MSLDTFLHDYEQRFIAFIDILGFSSFVRKTQMDKTLIPTLCEALRIVGGKFSDRVEGFREQGENKLLSQDFYEKVRKYPTVVFSDSIVLTGDNNLNGLFVLFLNVSAIALNLLKLRLFVRGGITIGPTYHDGSVIFGPALINAYEIENGLAIYPRIVVSDAVIKRINSPNHDEYACRIDEVCRSLLRHDFDGLYYLNFLSGELMGHWMMGLDENRRREELEGFRALIEEHLNKQMNVDLRLHVKFRWFASYFNAVTGVDEDLGISPIEV